MYFFYFFLYGCADGSYLAGIQEDSKCNFPALLDK